MNHPWGPDLRVRRRAALGMIAAATILAAAASAQAAPYHAYLCRIPYGPNAGAPTPTTDTTWFSQGAGTATDTCATGGAMTAQLAGTGDLPVPSDASFSFIPQQGAVISSFRLWRAMSTAPAGTGDPTARFHWGNNAGFTCLGSAFCQRGTTAEPLSPANVLDGNGLVNGDVFGWQVFCNTGTGGGPIRTCPPPPSGVPRAIISVYAVDVMLDDRSPPTVRTVAGPLLAPGTLDGPKTVSVDATDYGTGVARGRIVVDGAVVVDALLDSNGGACANLGVSPDGIQSFTRVQPCAFAATGTLTLDTDKLAPGRHALKVVVADGSGGETVADERPIAVVGVRPIANGAGASRLAKLTAKLAGARKGVRRLGFRTAPKLSGRLVNEAGTPISGARIDVLARERRTGAPTVAIATATTGADGAFVTALPAGPSRTLTFSYTAFAGDPKPARSVTARTAVRAPLTGAASPRSPRVEQRLHIAGRLRYLPRGGVEVAIQAREGRVWRNIDTVKTRKDGRYSWPYRFSRSKGGRRFFFRARVSSSIYPFDPGTTRTIVVRVRR